MLTARDQILLLIAVAALVRVALASVIGLGIDESYMVAAGRVFRLGYFDHPPASWWMAWSAARLAGSDSPVIVRLPFIALFAVSTWLLYRIGALLFTPRAGVLAALALNLAPVFGVTTGGWVLPDGPLVAGLLGAALCLAHALPAEPGRSRRWWLGAGLCLGLALFSKYSAVLTLGGAFLYLLTERRHRHWLARPDPYLAVLVAALVFSPVVAWNATHGWASFAFQGGRASAVRLHPLGPLATLAGESLYLLPWLWAGLMLAFLAALRRGPGDWRSWLLACLGAPPIVLFCVVALWSSKPVLFHWADPGYLMLFPLLGAALDRRLATRPRQTRAWIGGSVAFVVVALGLAATEMRFDWFGAVIPGIGHAATLGRDAEDWTGLRQALDARGLLRPGLVVATLRWQDSGKVDYALGGAARVICLNPDARQYRFAPGPAELAGQDALVVFPQRSQPQFDDEYAAMFDRVQALPPVGVLAAGQPVVTLALVMGTRLHPPPSGAQKSAQMPQPKEPGG